MENQRLPFIKWIDKTETDTIPEQGGRNGHRYKEIRVAMKKQDGSQPALYNINYIDNVHSKDIVNAHLPLR